MLPRNLESNSSLEGMFAISAIPLASYTTPSTTPALISSALHPLANFAKTLAGAVASSLLIAIAFVPSRLAVKPSNSVPANARVIIVFL